MMVGLLYLIGFYNRRAEIVSVPHIHLQGSSWNFIANLANLPTPVPPRALIARAEPHPREKHQRSQQLRFFRRGAGCGWLGSRKSPLADDVPKFPRTRS